MKLTESRIKEIIKEEITRISEQDEGAQEGTEEAVRDIINNMPDEKEKLLVLNYIASLKQDSGV